VLDLDPATFDAAIAGDRPVAVLFWAAWSAPDRLMAPIFAEVAAHFGGRMLFARVLIDDAPELGARFGIYTIPQVLVFRGGDIERRVVGLMSAVRLALALYHSVE
jgi:thioredoxin-like negative regulator of GroEL